MIFYISILT